MSSDRTDVVNSGGRIRGLLPLFGLLLAPTIALALATASTSFGVASASKPSVGAQHVVEITQFQFTPATLRVKQGDTVVWKNRDAAPHTATSTQWDSDKLDRNQSWSLEVQTKGSIEYICAFHPMMRGTIIVE